MRHIFGHIVQIQSSAFVRAKPQLLAASEIGLGCSEGVMVTSDADGCPADQLGKYMSPGVELLSGIKFFCSQTDTLFAVKQAANILSLALLCHGIIYPDRDSLKHDHPACLVYRFDIKGIFVPQCITENQSDTSILL